MTLNRRRTLAALALLGGAPSYAQAPLRFGLAPYLSPAALLGSFRPLREHLERALSQPVEMRTERDFAALAAAVQRSDFDLALLPAHLARLALTDWGWTPLARGVASTEVQVLVRADGPVQVPQDLRRRRVGMLDPLSLTAAVGMQWLQTQAPPLADGVEVVALPSVNSDLYALAGDEIAGLVATATQLQGLPPQTPANHRVLARLPDIPGPCHVARPGIPAATAARWREAMLSFTPDPQRPLIGANARLRPFAPADLDSVEPYAARLRRLLAAPR